MTRQKQQVRHVEAGCRTCHSDRAHWTGANAQAVAARHHDGTGHPTWCRVSLSIAYGEETRDDRQIDIEDTLAAIRRAGPATHRVTAPETISQRPQGATPAVRLQERYHGPA